MAGPPPGASTDAKIYFEQPDYRPPTYGSLITFSILAFAAVAIRIYTRIFIVRNLGPEDWMIGASLVRLKIRSTSGKHP